jgi:hypothetical protein
MISFLICVTLMMLGALLMLFVLWLMFHWLEVD